MRWEAILLAGGALEKDLARFQPLPSKAYIPLSGKPMAAYALEALREVPETNRIVAVIPEGAEPFPGTVRAAAGRTILESMASGFAALLPETEMGLLVTCDLPCLSAEAVRDFMRKADEARAGLCYSFVSKVDSEARFPGIPHTYIKLVEGEFCGGGLIAIAPRHFRALRSFADRATRNRKNLVALAGLFGIPFIVKLLLRRLSIRDAEARATALLGSPVRGIQSRFPEIAFNVDTAGALELAEVHVKEKSIPWPTPKS